MRFEPFRLRVRSSYFNYSAHAETPTTIGEVQ